MTTYSILQPVIHPLFEEHKISVEIKRDDLIHPVISGNKWRKLKYNIDHVVKNQLKGIVSFGGGYSNHIHALAYACHQAKIKSIGLIRGEAQYANNFTLTCAKKWGMQLQFVDRKTYRRRQEKDFLDELEAQYKDYFIIPEGGTNHLALPGVAEICYELNNQTQFDTLITPVGSAGTLSGLIVGDKNKHNIIGIAILKQAEYLLKDIANILPPSALQYNKWQLMTDYHCGGYAKFSQEALMELRDFINKTQIPFEPIYSGKMILALLDLVKKNTFPKGHRIVLLHTGGLQGLVGLSEQNKIKAAEWPLPSELQAL